MLLRAGLVKHAAWLLQREEHLNSCYLAQDVALAFSVIADVSNNESVTVEVDASLISTSFKYDNNNECTLLLKDLGIGTVNNEGFFLHAKRYREVINETGCYGEWTSKIGCYSSVQCFESVTVVSRFHIAFEDEKRESLIEWLEDESTKRNRVKARKRKSADNNERRQLKKLSPIERLNDADKRVKEAMAVLKKALLDKKEVEEELKKGDERNVVTPTPMEPMEPMPVLANQNKCTVNLHYTLDGVRGHLLVEPPKDGVSIILASDLEDNLQHIDYKEKKADKRAKKAAKYTPFQHGMCQGWSAPGTMSIATCTLTSIYSKTMD